MASYERLDYGSPDGSQWGGASSDALACYGNTPVTRYADGQAASTYPPYSQSSATASTFGFASALHFTTFVATVSSIQAALTRFGIMT